MGKNVLIKIEYDGTDFCGWQIQPKQRTVQGEIEHVLRYIAGEEVTNEEFCEITQKYNYSDRLEGYQSAQMRGCMRWASVPLSTGTARCP